jgi:hypothetical protein
VDAGVGIALVVVADEQRVVVAVQRAGDRADADVGGGAVAAIPDVDEPPDAIGVCAHGTV